MTGSELIFVLTKTRMMMYDRTPRRRAENIWLAPVVLKVYLRYACELKLE